MADKIYGSNNEPLKIQFITDTHYYSRKNGTQGKAYEKDESKSQMVVKDSDLVLKRAFDMLCEDTIGSVCPITPVDATSTSSGGMSSLSAASSHIRRAFSIPSAVAAFAFL